MKKQVATKHHPLFQNEETLDFGEFEDVTELTVDQEVDAFLSKYMDVINPVGTYKTYFDSSAKTIDHILRDVKLYYKKLVLEGKWSERKYVEVINSIFEQKLPISVTVLDTSGLMFDRKALPSQKRSNGRRRRI